VQKQPPEKVFCLHAGVLVFQALNAVNISLVFAVALRPSDHQCFGVSIGDSPDSVCYSYCQHLFNALSPDETGKPPGDDAGLFLLILESTNVTYFGQYRV